MPCSQLEKIFSLCEQFPFFWPRVEDKTGSQTLFVGLLSIFASSFCSLAKTICDHFGPVRIRDWILNNSRFLFSLLGAFLHVQCCLFCCHFSSLVPFRPLCGSCVCCFQWHFGVSLFFLIFSFSRLATGVREFLLLLRGLQVLMAVVVERLNTKQDIEAVRPKPGERK